MPSSPSEREALSKTHDEIEQGRRAAEGRVRELWRFVAQVIIGVPSRRARSPINSGSAVLVRLSAGPVVLTANHVIASYEKNHRADPEVILQIGRCPLTLADRPMWRNAADDIAALTVSEAEAERIGTLVHQPVAWPPIVPQTNDFVTVIGLPETARTRPDFSTVIFGPMVAHLPVLSGFENHFTCRIEREYIEPLSNQPLPTDANYGGMSGGPVFLDADLHYPIVGLVKEIHPELEYFVIQGLRGVPARIG